MATIVISGCSTGFGFESALRLAREGHTVFAGVRNPNRVDGLRSAVAEESLPLSIVRLDVTEGDSVRNCIRSVIGDVGRIDVLINNAGVLQLAPVEDIPEADARVLMETNFFGPLRLIQSVLPHMRNQGSGTIINVSSVGAEVTFPCAGVYAASKAALEALSEALALEVEQFGIQVVIIQPGNFATAIDSNARPIPSSYTYAGLAEQVLGARSLSLARAGPSASVADAILEIIQNGSVALRIAVGEDAQSILEKRHSMSDLEFFRMIRRSSILNGGRKGEAEGSPP